MLERKIDLCENYVSVYSKVEPSLYTKWRGRILEEMVGPIAMQAKRRYESKQVIHCDNYGILCLTLVRHASAKYEASMQRLQTKESHCLQINKGEFNAIVVKCLGLIRQAVKCRQFERPAAAAASDGIGGNKAAIGAIMKEFNDIISSVKDV